jgi:hypothetical protein
MRCSHRKRFGPVITALAAVLVAPIRLSAQSAQAARGAAISEEELQHYAEEIAFIRQMIDLLSVEGVRLNATAEPALRARLPEVETALTNAISTGTAALAATGDATQFQKLAAEFREKVSKLAIDLPGRAALTLGLSARAAASSPPHIFTAVPDVVFTIGLGVTGGPSAERYGSTDLETNLIGAAAGVVFDAIGEKKLAEYLKNNFAAGAGFPLNKSTGKRTLTNHAAIGLGEAKLGTIRVWPALSTEQTDTSDRRIPQDVVSSDQTQKSWATPTFAVSLMREAWLTDIRAGKLRPIITVGIRFPQYYPGDPYQAIAALFSSSREKFRRAGGYRFSAAISVPLLKVKSP